MNGELFRLARLRLVALTAEYLGACVPDWREGGHAPAWAVPSMTRDAMVAAILAARTG